MNYNKHFNFIMDDTKNKNEDDTKNKNEREEKMEVRTVTLDAPDYDTMKSKAEAFDKLIEIACHDGVDSIRNGINKMLEKLVRVEALRSERLSENGMAKLSLLVMTDKRISGNLLKL